jgi:hypothetical protein
MADMPGKDAHYLRGIRDALIERVSDNMIAEIGAILVRPDLTARAKRVEIHELAERHHNTIAVCFDDWKRSTMWLKCRLMVKHGILDEKYLAGLTSETAEHIKAMRSDAV